jgi:hypothetical protein
VEGSDLGRRPEPGLLAIGGAGQRNAVPYEDFSPKNVRNHAIIPMPVRTSALRALGAYVNVFAIESFTGERILTPGSAAKTRLALFTRADL